MRKILLAVVLVLLVGCADKVPGTSTADEVPSTTTEDFCSIVQELDGSSDAALAAVFGQGFDARVLTPAEVEEGLDRQRRIQDQLSEAAPADAPEAIDRYLDIRSDYMDAVEENGFDPDPDNLDGEDPRVLAWQDELTRAIEDEVGSYIESTCPHD